MRQEPAGDFDYERSGDGYAQIRRPEPAFATRIRRALGGASTLLNVGAGSGSYEPTDLTVTAVEPSASMRSQRPLHLTEAIDAVAEELPFDDDSFDAALASVTVHQWRDLPAGLAEIRRVTTGPVVIMTFDPVALERFWLTDYAPEMMRIESGRMPSIDLLGQLLGGQIALEHLPIPHGCSDGFAEAFFGRPEAFLSDDVRRSQSAWGFVSPEEERRSVLALTSALEDGSWDARHGALREAATYDGSLRLVISTRR